MIIFTAVPATPFTVVVNVFTDELLETEVTVRSLRSKPPLVIPLTVVVIVVPDISLETLLIIGTDVPATPLTVVVNVFPVLVLATLFTDGAVTETPFTTEVRVLTALLSVCVVVAGAVVVGAQAVPFQPKTCPLVAPVTVPSGEPFILDTTVAPKFPVTSPAVAAVNTELATPLTVLINWFVPF